jgi:hypothetical protein
MRGRHFDYTPLMLENQALLLFTTFYLAGIRKPAE